MTVEGRWMKQEGARPTGLDRWVPDERPRYFWRVAPALQATAASRHVRPHLFRFRLRPVWSPVSTFADQVADALLAESNALGARWQGQARAVAPRATGRQATPGGGTAAVPAEALAAAAGQSAPAIVNALACALRNTPRCQDGVLRAGWEYGAATHRGGAALHHVAKEPALLAPIAPRVIERARDGRCATVVVAVARV